MKNPDELYADYLAWCAKNNLPCLSSAQYEKLLSQIPNQYPKTDAILRNNNQRKDK